MGDPGKIEIYTRQDEGMQTLRQNLFGHIDSFPLGRKDNFQFYNFKKKDQSLLIGFKTARIFVRSNVLKII